jgi:hypothetical protein
MRKLGVGAVALSALLALLQPAASTAATSQIPCRGVAREALQEKGNLETAQLQTFYIEAKPLKKSYTIGETVKMAVTITRPAKEDPLYNDIPMDTPLSEPAADVNVGVGLTLDDVFLAGFAITKADGKTVVPVKLPKYAVPAKAYVSIYAYKTDADTPCVRVDENGFRQYPDMLTVKK